VAKHHRPVHPRQQVVQRSVDRLPTGQVTPRRRRETRPMARNTGMRVGKPRFQWRLHADQSRLDVKPCRIRTPIVVLPSLFSLSTDCKRKGTKRQVDLGSNDQRAGPCRRDKSCPESSLTNVLKRGRRTVCVHRQ
jgi:hypothetical protein